MCRGCETKKSKFPKPNWPSPSQWPIFNRSSKPKVWKLKCCLRIVKAFRQVASFTWREMSLLFKKHLTFRFREIAGPVADHSDHTGRKSQRRWKRNRQKSKSRLADVWRDDVANGGIGLSDDDVDVGGDAQVVADRIGHRKWNEQVSCCIFMAMMPEHKSLIIKILFKSF